MTKIERWQKKVQKYSTKMQAAIQGGKPNKAAKYQRLLTKYQGKLASAGATATVAAVGIGAIAVRTTARARVGTISAKTYAVSLDRGAIKYTTPSGNIRTLGYTPAKAKKMYKTKRRRKRLTKRDQVIIAAMQANPQAAPALSVML